MAYDRYDRDDRSRWSDDRYGGRRDERGFWDRASDEVASWFGDDDAERRRRQDTRRDEHMGDHDRGPRSNERWSGASRDYDRGYGRDYGRDQTTYGGGRSDRDFNYDRGVFNRGGSSERDYNREWRGDLGSSRDSNDRRDWDQGRNFGPDRDYRSGSERGYRPMTGDYGRNEGASDRAFGDYDRSQTPHGRDENRRTSFAGSRVGNDRDYDSHYHSWRDRHMSDLDRDYDDYRRENQSRFENDFTSWRQKRQDKRGLLGEIREQMEVVGKDDKHVGTVDRVARDRIILTKSDPDSDGVHHSLSCSDIDHVEGDKVILDCSADEAKNRWREENRGRALFERDDQGEMGPRNLNRSFEGTYR